MTILQKVIAMAEPKVMVNCPFCGIQPPEDHKPDCCKPKYPQNETIFDRRCREWARLEELRDQKRR